MKTIFQLAIIILSSASALSCDQELNEALAVSGSNRQELQIALKHYRGDRQKSKAVRYLIKNARYHYYSDTSDLQLLSSEYLISNVDSAFRRWESSPYLQHLSEDEFYESVLPYKVFPGQAPDDWRKRLSIPDDSRLNRVRKIDVLRWDPYVVLDRIQRTQPKKYQGLNTTDCEERATITALYGRALWIPVVEDYVPAWPKTNGFHAWNKCLSLYEKVPMKDASGYAKVFRKTFAPDKTLMRMKKDIGFIPAAFRDGFCRDVTNEYTRTCDIKVRVSGKNQYAFLAVFNSDEWKVVDYTVQNTGECLFKNVGLDVLYMAGVMKKNGEFIPASAPFYVDRKGAVSYIDNLDSVYDVSLFRKYKALPHLYGLTRTIESPAFIVGSENKAFINADTIAVVPASEPFDYCFTVERAEKYRYCRLCTSAKPRMFFAEIVFYDDEMGKLEAKTDCVKIVDNDLLTNEGVNNDNDITFDFGEPKTIKSGIVYRRADGNSVFPGHCYELYLWRCGEWELLGQQVAQTNQVVFKAVPGGLYKIVDVDDGSQNGVFIWNDEEKRPVWL